MFYIYYITYLLCLNVSLLIIDSCAQESKYQDIERKTMNNKEESKNMPSNWIKYINNTMTSQMGQFEALDSFENQIILEWEKVDPTTLRANQIIKYISEVLVPVYGAMELEFAKKHPEEISSQMFLKPLAPMFNNGVDNVDWKAVEQGLTINLQKFFSDTDFAKYSNPDEIQIFVIAKDKASGAKLGVIQFIVTAEFDYGTLKVAFFGVSDFGQSRGIEKLLLSTIFKLIPEVSRVFLHTRTTNKKALEILSSLDFARFPGPLAFWVDMEYLVNNSNILQKTSKTLDK